MGGHEVLDAAKSRPVEPLTGENPRKAHGACCFDAASAHMLEKIAWSWLRQYGYVSNLLGAAKSQCISETNVCFHCNRDVGRNAKIFWLPISFWFGVPNTSCISTASQSEIVQEQTTAQETVEELGKGGQQGDLINCFGFPNIIDLSSILTHHDPTSIMIHDFEGGHIWAHLMGGIQVERQRGSTQHSWSMLRDALWVLLKNDPVEPISYVTLVESVSLSY